VARKPPERLKKRQDEETESEVEIGRFPLVNADYACIGNEQEQQNDNRPSTSNRSNNLWIPLTQNMTTQAIVPQRLPGREENSRPPVPSLLLQDPELKFYHKI
jgi:hypothetical protein